MRTTVIGAVCLFLPAFAAIAQLVSPGKLSSVHASLEGVNDCTKCHNFGAATFRANCLACHTEIKARIDRNLGYHSFTRKLECSSCHKEHHGRDFKLIRWDPSKFDHRQTGFALEGRHAGKECRSCHQPKNIVQKEILKKSDAARQRTFLGLEPACGNCHADEHRGQLGEDCARCHTADDWKKNSFSHAKARFVLAGKHASVSCDKCHPEQRDQNTIAGNTTYRKFKGIAFKSCLDCHEDHHKGSFGKDCASCHSPADWKLVRVSQANFDHSKTHFALEGRHAKVECTRCHAGGDPTRFKGKDLTRCSTCHADAHNGQFAKKEDGLDCRFCHTVDGFAPSTFDTERHAKSRFPLSGAHAAIPCDRCHGETSLGGKSAGRFHWDSFACTECHRDPHAGQFSARMGTDGCQSCHNVYSWFSLSFSHAKTDFPLTGKHRDVPCAKCHLRGTVNGTETVMFRISDRACDKCHTDRHQGQFAGADGRTACTTCHAADGWKPSRFDHVSMSAFRLTGKHAALPCSSCHREAVLAPGREPTVKYKGLGTQCSSCHAEQQNQQKGDS